MKIAFFVHKFPELSETFVVNQITGLIDAGHEVDVYASGPGRSANSQADIDRYRLLERTHYWRFPGSHLVRAINAAERSRLAGWRRGAFALSLLDSGVRRLRRRRYDVVHCQFATLARAASVLGDVGAIAAKLVVSYRGSDLTRRTAESEDKEILRRPDLLLPVCEEFREELIRRGADPGKIRVHHSGIRLSLFAYTERRRTSGEPTRILSIGRLVEKKGVAYGIRAVARLKASGRRLQYTVVGDGRLRSELDRMIDESGLRAEVRLAGAKSHAEVVGLLRDAHLFVAPCVTAQNSDREGIPNVLKEAMATGLPVISTQHSGIPELVESGVSGVLVPERDSEALAARLGDLMDHPERWPAMGRAGRERVEAAFDSEKLNAELIKLYQQVVSGIASAQRS